MFRRCIGTYAKCEGDATQAHNNLLSSLASTSVTRTVHRQNMNLAAVLIPPSLDAIQAPGAAFVFLRGAGTANCARQRTRRVALSPRAPGYHAVRTG
jgi:hypothetical protein